MAEPPEGMGKGDDKEQSGLDSATCDSIFGGFSQDIQPIFTGNCALSGCHDNNTATEGIVLESHGQIMDEVKNGKVLCAIQHEAGCTNMPQGQAQLAAEDIEAIKCWKNAGYPND